MPYDFSTLTDRRNTNSLKWDVDENVLPMQAADMDFKTAPEIIEAIQEKVEKQKKDLSELMWHVQENVLKMDLHD